MITFFQRGNGPLVSVLIPTRGRPLDLCESIDSIYSLAMDKNHLEFILKIDDDDTETIRVAERLEKILPLKKIVSPRGNGFHDMHHWVNDMCRLATGDWLFLFNDDARMLTQDWDKPVLLVGTMGPWEGIDDLCLLVAFTQGRPFAQEFVMLRRKTFNILGHFSLSPHNDNWIYSIMKFASMSLFVDIYIDHRSDTIGDQTRQESEEAYKTTIDTLNSLEARRSRFLDLHTILKHSENAGARLIWKKRPTTNSWYWLKAPPDARRQHVLVVDDGATVMYLKDGQMDRTESTKDINGVWAERT